jgi:glyoxylase-like metal-dependent hydrolase (beta-lactamase superfamily II)
MQEQKEVAMTAGPTIKAFFDEPTNTISYLVADPATKRAAIVDPVLDYDHASGKASTKSADVILDEAEALGLTIDWVLETHAHADHLSAAPYIKGKTGAKVGIGEHIRDVQRIFRPVFNAGDVSGDGREFDHLFKDGERFKIGSLETEVLYTPGHTPACVSYKIGDAVFVGDTMFMPDYGTARADFPGGDAHKLYRSIRRLLDLPPQTRLFMCHDYKAPGRDRYAWETTVAEERARNVHVRDGVGEDEFVKMDNGVHYLKVPIKLAS